jgi:hypothetical protein
MSPAELQQHPIHVETNSWSFSANIKHILIYPAVIILLSLFVNYLFITDLLPVAPFANIIYAAAFLLIGIVHIFIYPKWLNHLWSPGLKYGVIYTAILALMVSVSSLLLFPIDVKQLQAIALTAGSGFVLPFAVYASVYYFRSIRAKEYQPWVIPPDAVPDTRKSLMLNSIGFKIKIKIKENDVAETIFINHFQAGLKLSTVFIRFLYDHSDTVASTDSDGNPYGWLFSTPGKGKMLEPDFTLTENGIKQDGVIIVERISMND